MNTWSWILITIYSVGTINLICVIYHIWKQNCRDLYDDNETDTSPR